MELNANFNKRVAVHAAKLPWKASAMPGVDPIPNLASVENPG